jgi:protease YdgD
MKDIHANWRTLAAWVGFCHVVLFTTLAADIAFAQQLSPLANSLGILSEKDRRVQIRSDQWPWSSLGRINVIGRSTRGLCTGTLIAPRRVLTAAQCLFDNGMNDWVKPRSIHFLIGQERDKFLRHSIVDAFYIPPNFAYKLADRPRGDMIDPNMIRHNWAILTLRDEVPGTPVPMLAVDGTDLPSLEGGGEFALAGYADDREFVISIHRGCKIAIDASDPGVITHMCDTLGQSGAPILLLSQGAAKVVGIHSSRVQELEPNVGWKTLKALGVSASEFGQSTLRATP